MLLYIPAADQNIYIKSVRVYIRYMTKLHSLSLMHFVRRYAKYGPGLSIDLVMEQVFMLKIAGGLTSTRYMAEAQQLTNQSNTIGVKYMVKVDGESIQVDPLLMFQRLTAIAHTKKLLF